MGRCIVLPSHRLPDPAGLAPCSEILQHPHGLPQALGSSSPPNWMPRILSEDSLCQKRKNWELWKSGRVRGPGEWAVLCPSLGSHQERHCPWMGGISQGVRLSLGCAPMRMLRTARGYIDPMAP